MQVRTRLTRALCGMALCLPVLALSACAGEPASRASWVNVAVTTGHRRIEFHTRARTVGEALAEAGFRLDANDRVSPPPETPLSPGMQVEVRPARPVNVTLYGRSISVRTAAETVAEVLAELGVELERGDRVIPPPSEPVPPTARIRVVRVRTDEIVGEEPIPYRSVRREDPSLPYGTVAVVQKGRPGAREVVQRAVYEDGELVRLEPVRERVVRPPVDEVLAYGTMGTVSRGGQVLRYREVRVMEATAYTPRDGGGGGITFSGTRARPGVAAVDPRVIPLGTRLYVDGYGFAVAEDTGSAIVGDRLDLCFESLAEALAWGRRSVKVYVLAD